ncbi:hypothetical protein LG047_14280 [Methylocystis sp. WRRC1]|uniref:hypothetical protein n=1 Tax=Methylocystis sp. WRRC1 TaxID=1732014 RepID=UPI001D139209|nr:hypothetical protein [Methylocystis sp. WRRC1]MCC3246470.1 hypothetical protein [Methylocystis sp. WRRC1]
MKTPVASAALPEGASRTKCEPRPRAALCASATWLLAIITFAGAGTIVSSPTQAQGSLVDRTLDWASGKTAGIENRERILTVLTHQRVISVRNGRIEVNDEKALKDYYQKLRTHNVLRNMPPFNDDPYDEKAGQFWRNFFDEKDHSGDPTLPRIADPFANPKLATAIHNELREATSPDDSIKYAETANELKMRGIDVMNQQLRKGVAIGAEAMIQSLNAITGGASGQTVKWVEAAAEAGQKASENPAAAVQNTINSKVDDAIRDIFGDKVKAAIGADNYKKIMDGYKKYGDEQQRLKAFMDDMYAKTGDERYKTASGLLDKASTDEIKKKLSEKSKELVEAAKGKLAGADKDKEPKTEKEKEEKEGKETEKQPGKDKTADKGKPSTATKAEDEAGKDSRDGSKTPDAGKTAQTGTKSWAQMTNQEKREALKANDPAAWAALGKLVVSDPSQATAILDSKKGDETSGASGDAPTGGDAGTAEIGQAIADAGAADIRKPPAATSDAKPVTSPEVKNDAQADEEHPIAPPAETPPQTSTAPATAGTTEVEGGWLQDKNGKTKVVYIYDAKGNRIGGYYVHYDKDGREIGRDPFKESGDETQQQPGAVLDGRYQGRITGKSSGTITLTVSGSNVSGTIKGVYSGDSFTARFSGSLNSDGSFDAAAQGVLYGDWGDRVTPYRVSGHVKGRVDGRRGAGSWSGKNQWGSDQGAWQASK